MRACGVHTYADYQALLDRSPAEYERLHDALTINVTRFYRNAETWNLLRRDLLPRALRAREARRAPGLERRLLLRRGAVHPRDADRPTTSIARAGRTSSQRLTVDATDIDRRVSSGPRRRATAREALAEMPAELVRALLRAGGRPSSG